MDKIKVIIAPYTVKISSILFMFYGFEELINDLLDAQDIVRRMPLFQTKEPNF